MNPRLRITTFCALATLLGSLSLLPIFDSYGWIPRVVLVVATVAATSALAQRVRALLVVAPLLMLVALAFMLTLLYAHQVAPLGFVPGPAAWRLLHQTLSNGFNDTTQLSAPVPITRGLSLMTTGGIGLVAVVVETLATGLRRPAVAGLPLLAIFTVPAAILNDGVGWQPFVFGAAGYLALLLAEGRERITRWGRPVRAQRPSRAESAFAPPTRQLATAQPQAQARAFAGSARTTSSTTPATTHLTQVGRRVGVAAIGVAVIVPVIIPGLHSGWFGTHHTSGAGGLSDGSNGTSINPIVSMRRDLEQTTPQPLFSYTTTGKPEYLRMLTLDKFDGSQWTPAAFSSPDDEDAGGQLSLPANVTVKPIGRTTTDVTVSGLKEPYLPLPMVPTTVKAHGDWLYNPTTSVVYSKHSSTIHLKYEVTSDVYSPDEPTLNSIVINTQDPSLAPYLKVPANLPATIQAEADNVIALAHATTPYQKAVALQRWFQSNFVYDVSVKSGSNTSALLSFLQDRTGYCEQFAATMALMARMEGIPSRVDVGFTPGSKIVDTDTYLVTTADAHAWPELYFPGAGWLRFEPTPRGDQTFEPAYSQATGPAVITSPSPGATSSVHPGGPFATPGQNGLPPGGRVGVPVGSTSGSGFHLPIGWLVVVFILLLGVLSSPVLKWWSRRRRWAAASTAVARAHAAWDHLGDDLRDLHLEWRGDDDTPRRAAAALLATRRLHYDHSAQQALERLARSEELARYASPTTMQLLPGNPRDDEQLVRRALFDSVPRTRRIRAQLVPASSARIFANLIGEGSDAVRRRAQNVGDKILAKVARRASDA